MGCTSGCMKCILNSINMLLAIAGILFIAAATYSLKTAPMPYVIFLYVLGSMNILAAIFGCCGICNENVCMTGLYAVMILVILIGELYNKFKPWDMNEIKKLASDDVIKTWNKEIESPGAMDKTQQTYLCCGKTGYNDYRTIGRYIVPASCYKNNQIDNVNLFTVGCIKAAEDVFVQAFQYSKIGEWVVIGITGVMFIFSIYLIFRFRDRQQRYRY